MSAPDPLVPANVDLRDFGYLPVDVRRLLTSDTWIAAVQNPRIGHAAMSLWLEAWHQVPAASLPNNDNLLCRLSMCPSLKEWMRVKPIVLAGYVLASDGRLYHPVVAEKAIEAWELHLKRIKRGKAGAEKRWGTNGSTKLQALRKHAVSNSSSMLGPMLVDSNRDGEGVSDAKASGGEPHVDDPDKALWQLGLRILTDAGTATERARGILGKHYKADRTKLAQVLADMAVNKPIEPVSYLQKAMQPPERKAVV